MTYNHYRPFGGVRNLNHLIPKEESYGSASDRELKSLVHFRLS